MAASTASIRAPAPPEHWYLTDDFNMPVTADTQRRENTLQSVFEAHVAQERDGTAQERDRERVRAKEAEARIRALEALLAARG